MQCNVNCLEMENEQVYSQVYKIEKELNAHLRIHRSEVIEYQEMMATLEMENEELKSKLRDRDAKLAAYDKVVQTEKINAHKIHQQSQHITWLLSEKTNDWEMDMKSKKRLVKKLEMENGLLKEQVYGMEKDRKQRDKILLEMHEKMETLLKKYQRYRKLPHMVKKQQRYMQKQKLYIWKLQGRIQKYKVQHYETKGIVPERKVESNDDTLLDLKRLLMESRENNKTLQMQMDVLKKNIELMRPDSIDEEPVAPFPEMDKVLEANTVEGVMDDRQIQKNRTSKDNVDIRSIDRIKAMEESMYQSTKMLNYLKERARKHDIKSNFRNKEISHISNEVKQLKQNLKDSSSGIDAKNARAMEAAKAKVVRDEHRFGSSIFTT